MEIKDSGARREFASGAVRDIQEGKGRFDLVPLDIAGILVDDSNSHIYVLIELFKNGHDPKYLIQAIKEFSAMHFGDVPNMLLEVAKHFEEGCKKYGDNNWRKGIPLHCYIDSATRHYTKFIAGWKDEPHDRAFVWNLMCCIWTLWNHPECNDLP